MKKVLSVVDLSGSRSFLHKPPTGTPSRILSLRLRRTFHGAAASRAEVRQSPPPNTFVGQQHEGSADILGSQTSLLEASSTAIDLLRRLATRYQSPADISRKATALNNNTPGGKLNAVSASQLPPLFRELAAALQSQNTQFMLSALANISKISQEELIEAVREVPTLFFSEILRSLDPCAIEQHVDETGGYQIEQGMWARMSLSHQRDEYGRSVLYQNLLVQVLHLVVARRESGHKLPLDDWVALFRFAGAARHTKIAEWALTGLQEDGHNDSLHGKGYSEFIKARYLTEPLYYDYNKNFLRLRPRSLWKQMGTHSNTSFTPRRWRKMEMLRKNTQAHAGRHGLQQLPGLQAESLYRSTRSRKYLQASLIDAHKRGIVLDEELLCTFIKAMSRPGMIKAILHELLSKRFGILVKKTQRAQLDITHFPNQVRESVKATQPTAQLLDAITESYGNFGEIQLALQLIDSISSTYRIPIPQKVWFDLLEWTYLHSSKPAVQEWRNANFFEKIPSPDAVEQIFNAMISEPYKIIPGFDQYNILIKNFIARGKTEEAVKYMRVARQFYDQANQNFEDAMLEYLQDRRLRSTKEEYKTSNSLQRYRRARFERIKIWYCLQHSCKDLLLTLRGPRDWHHTWIAQGIPDFIREFSPFIQNPIRYRTVSGYVDMIDSELGQSIRSYRDQTLLLDIHLRLRGRPVVSRRKKHLYKYFEQHGQAPLVPTRASQLLDLAEGSWIQDFRREEYLAYVARNADAEGET